MVESDNTCVNCNGSSMCAAAVVPFDAAVPGVPVCVQHTFATKESGQKIHFLINQ